jgi:tRNA pseudouridine55 synthase
MNGALVVDKPAGWTSHDVVNKVRRLAGTRKVGHLGTLDPIATGVLPLLLGGATRLAQFFGRADKRYEGTVRFGFATDTYDAAGKPVTEPQEVTLNGAEIERALDSFRGRIRQIPPPVSAKKIAGVRAYKLARQNKPVLPGACDVEIFSLQIARLEGNELDLRIHCSAGTYVRSIAHELGQVIGCGAFLQRLRRTGSGSFCISDARTLEELGALSAEGRFIEAVIPASRLLPELPAEIVDASTVAFIRQGRDFRLSPFRSTPDAALVKAVGPDGELVAIGEARLPHVYHPILVL